jgi:hypothetical protein
VKRYVRVNDSLQPDAIVTSLELTAKVEQASVNVPPARVKSSTVVKAVGHASSQIVKSKAAGQEAVGAVKSTFLVII